MTAPLRWRLALTFTVGLALVLITGAAAFALILQRGYREDFDRELFEVAHASRAGIAPSPVQIPASPQAATPGSAPRATVPRARQ